LPCRILAVGHHAMQWPASSRSPEWQRGAASHRSRAEDGLAAAAAHGIRITYADVTAISCTENYELHRMQVKCKMYQKHGDGVNWMYWTFVLAGACAVLMIRLFNLGYHRWPTVKIITLPQGGLIIESEEEATDLVHSNDQNSQGVPNGALDGNISGLDGAGEGAGEVAAPPPPLQSASGADALPQLLADEQSTVAVFDRSKISVVNIITKTKSGFGRIRCDATGTPAQC
jgi:hypothetical protein